LKLNLLILSTVTHFVEKKFVRFSTEAFWGGPPSLSMTADGCGEKIPSSVFDLLGMTAECHSEQKRHVIPSEAKESFESAPIGKKGKTLTVVH